ncbi:MAG: LacI family DNA-binding transcriptional regulator [Lachnospiraceae bacterium]|nr:LacI family DNA-binding transcriptional regulator [Lachnospiraceae bacterium]
MNLKQIAELAGVSTATVSNVVNGNDHKVSAQTREKIEKIIQETNYKPSIIARSLARGESKMIGVIVPYLLDNEDFLSNPYYARVIAAIERYIRVRDYYLMLRCVRECTDIAPLLNSWNVDGAIFLGVFRDEIKNITDRLDIPVVFMDTYSAGDNIVNVGIDDYRGGFLSASYLIGKGHKNIALVTPEYKPDGVIHERYKGFSDACKKFGVEFKKEDVFITDTIYDKAIKVGQDIAFSKKKYTAVATFSDVVAFGITDGMSPFGLRVPEDVSVIGFDNIPEAEIRNPRLTTISQDYRGKAEKSCELLLRMIGGEKIGALNYVQPVQVIERNSVKEIV